MTDLPFDGPPAVGAKPRRPRTAGAGWLAVAAVTAGVFSLMTSELLPVGLLTPVGADLNVSEGSAGLMVTVPGLVAAVSAPLVTVAASRVERRRVLALLVGMVGAANLASAIATSFALVLAARVLIGISVGGFWSIAPGIAPRLVAPRHAARATAVVFGGVEAASVLGVPAGTILGDLGGWRVAFAAVGVLGLAAVAGIVMFLPRLPAERGVVFADLPAVWRTNGAIRLGIVMTFLVVTGHFSAYTFARPLLRDDGVDSDLVGVLLLVFGAAGLCGNFVAGALVVRHPRQTLRGVCVVLATAMTLSAWTDGVGVTVGLLVVWGLGYGAVPVTLQSWILQMAGESAQAASSLYVCAFNLSIALGALLGGVAVDSLATASVLWIGGALSVLALSALSALSGQKREPA